MENNQLPEQQQQQEAAGGGSGSYPNAPFHQLLQQQQQQNLQMFWNYQRQEIEHTNDFKNHLLPLARIKKIMKADEDVRMISAEAPILFAKACELFILELTIRSWLHAEENKRRTLQKNDIAAAITRTDIFDFLVDIVPKDEGLLGLGISSSSGGGFNAVSTGIPYYYPPPPQQMIIQGQPAVMAGIDPVLAYGQQQQWPQSWQQHPSIPDDGGGESVDDHQQVYVHPNTPN